MFEEQYGDGRARGAVVGWAPQQFGAWHLPPPALMMPYCPSSSVSHPQSGRHPLPAVELYESPCPVIVCTVHECTLFVVLWEWQITSLWGETGLWWVTRSSQLFAISLIVLFGAWSVSLQASLQSWLPYGNWVTIYRNGSPLPIFKLWIIQRLDNYCL